MAKPHEKMSMLDRAVAYNTEAQAAYDATTFLIEADGEAGVQDLNCWLDWDEDPPIFRLSQTDIDGDEPAITLTPNMVAELACELTRITRKR